MAQPDWTLDRHLGDLPTPNGTGIVGATGMDRIGAERMNDSAGVDRQTIHEEMEHARARFHLLLSNASTADLKRQSNGTRWNNEQLLFHMVFGYLVVRVLLGLVKAFGRLPDPASRAFAKALNSVTGPFHIINYLGSCGGAIVFGHRRMGRKFDRVIASLHRHLDAETETALHGGMHFPRGWDPFFRDFMTLEEVYRYPTQHFDFHCRQLSFRVSE